MIRGRKEEFVALDAGFVAAVLEGIEDTLAELIERVDACELRASLDVLQSRVSALRVSIEPTERSAGDRDELETAVGL
ncbi:MAG: hypothetical protein LC130_37280 [Bryobacterales bacterium]|nr:hypothetical protein [Bryobacterales bacterium]